jgi:VWFA-related protein
VAVYALTTQLLLLHEFTQDASVLVTAASQFKPKKSAAYDASHTAFFDVPALADEPSWVKFQAATNEANAKIADQAQVNRAETTMEALERLADHAAAIPGHKSLVWVSGGFPLQILIGALSPDRETRSLDVYAKRASQALNRVDLAVYPVDASGVVGNASMDPSTAHDYKCMDCKLESPGPSSGMNERQAHRDAERTLADTTGGQVFYGSNDITVAMKKAVDDGRYAYTIAFYPSHGKWDGRFRKLKVQVKASGVQARYRTGYFANAESGGSEGQAKEALKSAAMSPLDATGLGLIVSGKLSGSSAERKIELHVTIDPRQLRLQNVDGHQKGGCGFVFRATRRKRSERCGRESAPRI